MALGELNGNSKLKNFQVDFLKKLYRGCYKKYFVDKNGKVNSYLFFNNKRIFITEISKIFNVTSSTCSKVMRGKTWNHGNQRSY